ncbi:unnamed protein product [Anisakis simplex]|uniref:Protein kinase domain-containing protein n=1 Tax=Anisakis simplex TaxID=6269 RepID=A0A0M3JZC3_ANISI|nr:unnamed protein product [Anisakis simplex]
MAEASVTEWVWPKARMTTYGGVVESANGLFKASSWLREGAAVDKCLVTARGEFEFGKRLGGGTFGSFYAGIWKTNEKSVGLKKIFQKELLQKEANVLSKIDHPNIIRFYGVSKMESDFFIVTASLNFGKALGRNELVEYAKGGSLYDYLHNPSNGDIDYNQMIIWALQIASAVAYLHNDAPERMVHCDLKASNIVLTGEGVCKLCDFGCSERLTDSRIASCDGTPQWMSPEAIDQYVDASGKEAITTATDVWSYGVVLWEMISRQEPHESLPPPFIADLMQQEGSPLLIPKRCPAGFVSLMENCWKRKPRERYDMRRVIAELKSMQRDAQFNK